MTSSAIRSPKATPSRTAIVQKSRNPRIRSILYGFTGDKYKAVDLGDIGISFRGPSPETSELVVAAGSGTRSARGRIGFHLKTLFLLWQYRWCVRFLEAHPDAIVLLWNGIKGHRRLLAHAARRTRNQVFFFEEAPLPGRVSIDPEGVNYGCSLPRQIEFYRNWMADKSIGSGAWRDLASQMKSRSPDQRRDVSQMPASTTLEEEPYLFCPLQVPGDSQLTVYGDWIGSVSDTIEALSAASMKLPDGWHLRVKEHPSAKVSFKNMLSEHASEKLRIDNSTDTFEQVAHSRGVVTVNSSVGLQSFFYDKPVIVMGNAFYAFPGLAYRAMSQEVLQKLLSDPCALGVDQASRDAFMTYLVEEFFPLEADVIAGLVGPEEVVHRPHLMVND